MKQLTVALLVALISVTSCTKQDNITPAVNGTWQCNNQWKIGLYDGSQAVVNLSLNFDTEKALFYSASDTVVSGSLIYTTSGSKITVKMIFPDSTLAKGPYLILQGSYTGSTLTLRDMIYSQQ